MGLSRQREMGQGLTTCLEVVPQPQHSEESAPQDPSEPAGYCRRGGATDIGSHSRRSRSVIFQSRQHRSVQLPVDDHHRMGDRHNGQVVSTIGELCHTNPHPAPRTSAPASTPSTPPPTTDRAMYPNGEGEAIRADAKSSTQHSKGRRPRPRVHDSAVTTPPPLRRRGRPGPVVVDETGAGTSPMYSPTRLGGPT